MHRRSIEELRLAFGVPIVDADPKELAMVCGGKRAKAEQSAFTAFNGLV